MRGGCAAGAGWGSVSMAVTSLAMRGAATGRVAVGFPWEVRQDALASTDGPMSIWGFLRDEVGGLYWTRHRL